VWGDGKCQPWARRCGLRGRRTLLQWSLLVIDRRAVAPPREVCTGLPAAETCFPRRGVICETRQEGNNVRTFFLQRWANLRQQRAGTWKCRSPAPRRNELRPPASPIRSAISDSCTRVRRSDAAERLRQSRQRPKYLKYISRLPFRLILPPGFRARTRWLLATGEPVVYRLPPVLGTAPRA